MAKLAETSEAVIMVSFIVMNLEKILSEILLLAWKIGLSLWVGLCTMPWLNNNRRPKSLTPCKIPAAVAC
jgi:hypothetical protein